MKANCENGCFERTIPVHLEKTIRELKKYHVCTECLGKVILLEDDGTAVNTEVYLMNLAAMLEPKTHCCECTPGKYFCVHMVHIQYPDCQCDPGKYILKRND